MTQPLTTRHSLLLRLRDAQDTEAWREFVHLYAPLVYRYGRRHGLQDADAADLTQEVLRAVSTSIGRLDYDPARGSFRGWLYTLAHRQRCDWLTRRGRQPAGTGDSGIEAILQQQPAPDDREQWERDHREAVFAWVAERVKPSVSETTWLAFWRTAVDGRSGEEVAGELGMSIAAVYLAKSRVMARMKDEAQLWDEAK